MASIARCATWRGTFWIEASAAAQPDTLAANATGSWPSTRSSRNWPARIHANRRRSDEMSTDHGLAERHSIFNWFRVPLGAVARKKNARRARHRAVGDRDAARRTGRTLRVRSATDKRLPISRYLLTLIHHSCFSKPRAIVPMGRLSACPHLSTG